MELKRVVVTGLGAITPIGNTVPETWENLVNGVSGAGPITHFDASHFQDSVCMRSKRLRCYQIYRPQGSPQDGPVTHSMPLHVAKEAVGDSGLDVENEDLNRIGVIFGAGIGGITYIRRRGGQLCPDR